MKWNKGRSKGYNVVVMNDESEKWTKQQKNELLVICLEQNSKILQTCCVLLLYSYTYRIFEEGEKKKIHAVSCCNLSNISSPIVSIWGGFGEKTIPKTFDIRKSATMHESRDQIIVISNRYVHYFTTPSIPQIDTVFSDRDSRYVP